MRVQTVRIDARSALHIAVVGLVVSSTVVGGGRLFASPTASGQSASYAPRIETPAAQYPASSGVAGIQAAAKTAVPKEDSLRMALGLPEPKSLSKVEDGVMAVRSVASSRGGSRAPEGAPEAAATPGPTPSPTPEPSPTPAPKKEFKIQTYRVVSGDTLLAIAARFGITPETVLWANDLRSADMLQIDHDLTILPVSGVLHKVGKGQTLGGIAEAYVAEKDKIIEVNSIPNPDALQEGQNLIIPGGMRRTTEPITGLPSAPSAQDLAAATKYTVKGGDTLLSIADAFGVRASTIQGANGIMDPDSLRIGLVLSIPGARQASSAPAPAPAPKAAPAPAPAPAGGSAGDRIAAIAQQYLGYRYVWGGHSPNGFDCSGYTWYVYQQAGISIPLHDLWGQIGSGQKIPRSELLPGDLVFWANTYTAGLSHSGIYLGGGRFINAETEAVGVQIRSMNDPYWSARFYGGARPW